MAGGADSVQTSNGKENLALWAKACATTLRPKPYINTIYAIWWEEWFVRNWVSQYVIDRVWEEWFDKKESRIWVMHDNNYMQFSCICGDGLDGSVRGEFWKFGDERTFGFMVTNGRILYH